MKKLMTIFGAFLFTAVIFSSCGGSNDAKENGEKAGKLDCEIKELQKQQKDNRDEMKDFKWSGDDADEESRKAHAKLQMSNVKLGIKIAKLRMKQSDLYNKSWTATEKEDDKQKWLKAYNKAQSDYVKDNCKK